MNATEFEKMRADFEKADVDRKVDIYVNAEGLSQEQYKELLRFFPLNELHKLEAALE